MPLDPHIQRFYEENAEHPRPALSDGSPEEARALLQAGRAALGTGPTSPECKTISIPTRAGSVPARIYLPQAGAAGLVVYLHGGGWVIGEAADYDAAIRTFCARSGCAFLVPEYRLAPEDPFPAGLEDVLDVVGWTSDNMTEIAGRVVPLILSGDSAGGNLSTVAARLLDGRADIAATLLIVPVTDSRMATESYREFASGFGLMRRDMEWFYDHYAPAELLDDPRISPIRQTDLSSLPRTIVVTAECDVLRDEGEAYANAMRAQGVEVDLRREVGMSHGFPRLHNISPAADAAVSRLAADYARLALG